MKRITRYLMIAAVALALSAPASAQQLGCTCGLVGSYGVRLPPPPPPPIGLLGYFVSFCGTSSYWFFFR